MQGYCLKGISDALQQLQPQQRHIARDTRRVSLSAHSCTYEFTSEKPHQMCIDIPVGDTAYTLIGICLGTI